MYMPIINCYCSIAPLRSKYHGMPTAMYFEFVIPYAYWYHPTLVDSYKYDNDSMATSGLLYWENNTHSYITHKLYIAI